MDAVIDFASIVGRDLPQMMSEPMLKSFSEDVFVYKGAPRRPGQKPEYQPVTSRGGYMTKFVVDRSVKGGISTGAPETPRVIALNIRRKGNMYFLSSFVCVHDDMK
ncbi:hypothetical protein YASMINEVIRUS_1597 [Yasminevirus sp. GU-2018]|uniref:Uncharacterized protein n=1 Tax=Yasminevirus sp. GU-2018 TaxID=2420051 RepID=A0A5K0UBG5_9VIRU|nr:hypothetical protein YASMINEVIRUS_1597 [Yasminevirus sp. GU-2018]